MAQIAQADLTTRSRTPRSRASSQGPAGQRRPRRRAPRRRRKNRRRAHRDRAETPAETPTATASRQERATRTCPNTGSDAPRPWPRAARSRPARASASRASRLAPGTATSARAGPPPSRPRRRKRAGAALAAELAPGDVVLVSGDLGAGQDDLRPRRAARAGRDGAASRARRSWSACSTRRPGPAAHLDLYRLGGLGDEDPGLLDPYFGPGHDHLRRMAGARRRHAAAGADPSPPGRARARRRRPRGRMEVGDPGLDTATPATVAARAAPGRHGRRAPRRSARRAGGPAHAEPAARAHRGRGRCDGVATGSDVDADRRRGRPRRLHRPADRHRDRARARPGARHRARPGLARCTRWPPAPRTDGPRAAVIDARRGEAFAAACHVGAAASCARPAALGPEALAEAVARAAGAAGRRRRRATLPGRSWSGPERPSRRTRSAVHRISAVAALPARGGGPSDRPRTRWCPTTVREPDAKPAPVMSSAASPTPTSRRSSRSSAGRSRRRGRWRCSCSSCRKPGRHLPGRHRRRTTVAGYCICSPPRHGLAPDGRRRGRPSAAAAASPPRSSRPLLERLPARTSR